MAEPDWKRMRPPQYLGGGTATRALGEKPTIASEPEYWTLQLDSQRANGRNTRRCDPTDGSYSDNAWLEVDIPYGWIPAEVGSLAVFVTDLQVTQWMTPAVNFTLALPSTYDASLPTSTSMTANNFYTNPSFTPFYCRPGSMATAAEVSLQDSQAFLAMIHRGRGFPHVLSSSGEEYVSLGSWPLVSGNVQEGAPVRQQPTPTPPYAHGGSVVQIFNPSGSTLRFEQRLMASNAMPSVNGSYRSETTAFDVDITEQGTFTLNTGALPAPGDWFRCRIGPHWRPLQVELVDDVNNTFTVVGGLSLATAANNQPCETLDYRFNDVRFGFPAWRATLKLVPIRAVQYGGVAVAPEGQFVG